MKLELLRRGIWRENPTFRLFLGMCPTLAVTTRASNGFWMGLSVLGVLTVSNVLVSSLRDYIPRSVRLPAFITIIATLVTLTDLSLHAFLPGMYRVLGIYVPLIAVNCIILARAEAFAARNDVVSALFDGVGTGLGATLALVTMGVIREFLGTGNLQVAGVRLFGSGHLFDPARVMLLPPGGFLVLALVLVFLRLVEGRGNKR